MDVVNLEKVKLAPRAIVGRILHAFALRHVCTRVQPRTGVINVLREEERRERKKEMRGGWS